jgi:parallel beta-helix repeat protein
MEPKQSRIAGTLLAAAALVAAGAVQATAAERVVVKHTHHSARAVLTGHHHGLVVFKVNGRRIHKATHAPYSVSLLRRTLVSHKELTAQSPQLGLLAAATLTPSAPTVNITSAPASSTTDTTASFAFATSGAKVVQCRIDDERYTACRTPYVRTGVATGNHIFRVRALNGSGHAMASSTWTVTTPGGPPPGGSVALTAPDDGVTVSGVVQLTATATATSGRVAWVDFLVDGNVVGSSSVAPYSYPLDAGKLAAGEHTLQAAVWDTSFNRTVSASETVNVSLPGTYAQTVTSTSQLTPALNAAAAAGGGAVRLAAGSYTLSGTVAIPAGVLLVGDGSGTTTLHGTGRASVVHVGGSHAALTGVAIDAAGYTGSAVDISGGVSGVLVQGVRVSGLGAGAKGVEIWGTHTGISIQDSSIDGAGTASTGIRDCQSDSATGDDSVFRTQVTNVQDYGVLFNAWDAGTWTLGQRNLAVGNTVRGVYNPATDNGTNEAGIWLGGTDNIAYGNTIDGTGWEGIWTGGMHSHPIVSHNTISNTKVAGVYLEHSSDDAVIEDNTISNTGTGINVEWFYSGAGSLRVQILRNIVNTASYGIFVDTGDDGAVVQGNLTTAIAKDPVHLQGVQHVTVTQNVLRGAQSYCVRESTGLDDQNHPITADYNTITANDCRGDTTVVVDSGSHDTIAGNTL